MTTTKELKAAHELVPLGRLKANPWRRLERYPPSQVKVDALAKSIQDNGWWCNLHARPTPEGDGFEIAYGHGRLVALRQLYSPDTLVQVMAEDLTDAQMIKYMADENLEATGADALGDIEIVEAVVTAYQAGKISPVSGLHGSDARSRKGENNTANGTEPIYEKWVARFLGWVNRESGGGEQSSARCRAAYQAYHAIHVDKIVSIDQLFQVREANNGRVTTSNLEAALASARQARKKLDAEAKWKQDRAKKLQESEDERDLAKAEELKAEAQQILADRPEAGRKAAAKALDILILRKQRKSEENEVVNEATRPPSTHPLFYSQRKTEVTLEQWAFKIESKLIAVEEEATDLDQKINKALDLAKEGGVFYGDTLHGLAGIIVEVADKQIATWQRRKAEWAPYRKVAKEVKPNVRALKSAQ